MAVPQRVVDTSGLVDGDLIFGMIIWLAILSLIILVLLVLITLQHCVHSKFTSRFKEDLSELFHSIEQSKKNGYNQLEEESPYHSTPSVTSLSYA